MVLYRRVEEKRRRRETEKRLVKGSSPYIRTVSNHGMVRYGMVWSSQVKVSGVVCVSEKTSRDSRSGASKHIILCSLANKPPGSLVRYLFLFANQKTTSVHFAPLVHICPDRHVTGYKQHIVAGTIQYRVSIESSCLTDN